jgi:hypothetical protein
MNTKRCRTGSALCVLLVGLAVLGLQRCGHEPEACMVCERQLHRGMTATLLAGGKRERTCCPSCALHYCLSHKNARLETMTDYLSNREIRPQTAAYVYGSDVEPCRIGHEAIHVDENTTVYRAYDRCAPSIIAFSERTDAAAFQKIHGGRLLSLPELESAFTETMTIHPGG